MVKQLIVILCIGWVGLAQDDHAGEVKHGLLKGYSFK